MRMSSKLKLLKQSYDGTRDAVVNTTLIFPASKESGLNIAFIWRLKLINVDNEMNGSFTNLLNVKVNFYLCLSTYYTMNKYPILNYVPSHKNILGNGGMAPHNLNLGARCNYACNNAYTIWYCEI
jgi:hypothetical protein